MVRLIQQRFLLLILASTVPVAVFAQVTTTGVVRGSVTDSTGGVLPGVTITISGSTVIIPLVATTSHTGFYQFLQVPVGVVELSAELSGFETVTVSGIVVNPGGRQSHNLVMHPSGVRAHPKYAK